MDTQSSVQKQYIIHTGNPFTSMTNTIPSVEIVDGKPKTTSLQVAAFFGKEHKNVLRDIQNVLETVGNFTGLNFELSEYKDSTGRKLPMYLMDKDAFTLLVMGYTGEEAMRFKLAYIRRFNEMEEELRKSILALPNFNDPIAAAEAWIVAERARQAEHARAELAIRTKAQIGSTREATSMATASAAVRKVNALEDELGIGRNYRAVKAIDWLLEEFQPSKSMYSQVGKKLAGLSRRMGRGIREVPNEEFGSVKAYHIDVIAAFRSELCMDRKMLWQYRNC